MTNLEVHPKTFPDGSENYGAGIIGPSKADVEWAKQFSNELAREDIVVASKESLVGRIAEVTLGRIPKPLRRFAIPAAVLAPLIAAACGGGNAIEPQVKNPDTPTIPPAATEPLKSPTRISETSSTAIATSESTPTPEILPECKIIPSLAPGVIKPEMLNIDRKGAPEGYLPLLGIWEGYWGDQDLASRTAPSVFVVREIQANKATVSYVFDGALQTGAVTWDVTEDAKLRFVNESAGTGGEQNRVEFIMNVDPNGKLHGERTQTSNGVHVLGSPALIEMERCQPPKQ